MINEQSILLALALYRLGFKEKISDNIDDVGKAECIVIEELTGSKEASGICKQIMSLQNSDKATFKDQLRRLLANIEKNLYKMITSMSSANAVATAILDIEDYLESRPISSNSRLTEFLKVYTLREKQGLSEVKFSNVKVERDDLRLLANIDIKYLYLELLKAYKTIQHIEGGEQNGEQRGNGDSTS